MDPTPWNLLHDGVIVAVYRHGADATLHIDCPHLRPEGFVLRLSQVDLMTWTPYDADDAAPLTDPDAIAAAAPNLVEAERAGAMLVVWGSGGVLRLRYASLSIDGLSLDALHDLAQRYWDGWRAAHTRASAAHPPIDRMAFSLRLERPDDFQRWSARWHEAPEAALAELARCALATWDLLRDPARSPDDAYADCARWWAGITRAVASLHGATPDARIGRGLEAVLRGPYDCWFLPTPERHTGSSSEAACFADHTLALLEHHADAGTAARLDHLTDALLLEADCNGAEAARRVHLLAQRLRTRFAEHNPPALKAAGRPRG